MNFKISEHWNKKLIPMIIITELFGLYFDKKSSHLGTIFLWTNHQNIQPSFLKLSWHKVNQ